MRPTASQNTKHIRKQIGSALWLFAAFACLTPADWNGNSPMWVASGNPLADVDLAESLQVSTGTIATWRRRLRAAGLITWLVAPGCGRVFFISALNGVVENARESKSAEKPAASKTERVAEASAPQRWAQ
jgi:hypothetical protein